MVHDNVTGVGRRSTDVDLLDENNSALPISKASYAAGELWRQAAAGIEWKQARGLDFDTSNTSKLLDEICGEALHRMDQAEDKRRKWQLRNGKVVSFRDIWGKVLVWVKRFQTIGDIAIQADAGYASLPWALVRLTLTAAESEHETRGAMLEGMEYISQLITQYLAVEQMNAVDTSKLAAGLRNSLVSLYKSVLQYLAYHINLLDRNSFKRLVKRLDPNSMEELKTLLGKIDSNKSRVDSDAMHLSNERTNMGINELQESQKYLITQHRRYLNLQQDFADNQLMLRSRQEVMQQQANKQWSEFRDIIKEWRHDTSGMQDQLSDIYTSTVEDANQQRILEWLSPIHQDLYHVAAQRNVLKSSGRWLLENPDFVDWRESSNSSVLWIHGLLGTGKTKLASIVIEDSFGRGRVAYFYCSRNEAGTDNSTGSPSMRGEPVEILRNITKQLAKARGAKEIESSLRYRYSQLKGRDAEEPRRLSSKECINTITFLSKDSPTMIIVDGLDECKHAVVPELIQGFEEIMKGSPKWVKILLTTRYVGFIVDTLKQREYPALEISADKNSDDIARFIDAEIENRIVDRSLLHGNVSADLRQEIRESLKSRADSMFWYASLQLNLLCDPTAEQDEAEIRQKLRQSPTTLKEAYARIIQEVEDPKNSRRSRNVAQNTITWLLCAQEPLSCGAFLEAVNEQSVDREYVIRVCRTLVIEDAENDVFEFSHLSVREYLEDTPDYRPRKQHLSAAERCLKMLETSSLSHALGQHITPSQEEFRRYAFLFWPLHYQKIDFDVMDERKGKLRAKLKSLLIRGSRVSPSFKQWMSQVKELERDLGKTTSLITKLKSLQASPESALFTACVFGFSDLIKQLKRTSRFNFDQCNIHNQTAVCLAVENNQIETLGTLLDIMPEQVNRVNQWAIFQFEDCRTGLPPHIVVYATPLQAAAANGLEAITRFLLEPPLAAKIDAVVGYYGNALQAAALKGHDDVVRILLEDYDAEPNSQGGFHGNALQAAAISGNEKSVALLIDHKALVSAQGGHYGSALMAAIVSGSAEVLTLLLEQEPNLNVKSPLYGAPLQKAADMNNKAAVDLLIEAKVEINASHTNSDVSAPGRDQSALALAAWGGHSKVVSILLENKAQADMQHHPETFHIFHQAAAEGMRDLVQYCLDHKCDISMTTTETQSYLSSQTLMTPLSFACAGGHESVATFLLERTASIEFAGDAASTLWLAARGGHSHIIRRLIDHLSRGKGPEQARRFVNRAGPEGEGSALHEATRSGSLETVNTLLELGARWTNTKRLASPLHIAAAQNRPDIVHLFMQRYQQGRLEGDFSIDVKDDSGRTSLAYAVEHDMLPIVNMLLRCGANPGICDIAKNSMFHRAVERSNPQMLEELLSASQPGDLPSLLDQRNSKGNTVLNDAYQKRQYASVELLLKKGAVWHDDERRETNLHRAARSDPVMVDEYISVFKHSDQLIPFLNSRNMYERSPLHSAAEFNQPKILTLLLEYGANIMALEDCSRTALFWAAERNHTQCVEALLVFASKIPGTLQRFIDHCNVWDRSALHETIMRRHLESVKLLLNHNADIIPYSLGRKTALSLTAGDVHNVGYKGCTQMASLILDKAEEAGRLLEVVNSHNGAKETGLSRASGNNVPEMVSLLLSRRGDYSISNTVHVTPLHRACWANFEAVAVTILEHASQDSDQARFRASLNQRDLWGRTPLNAAACNGHADIVSLLLEKYNADYAIACPGKNVPEPWFTPLHYGLSKGHERVIEVLLQYVSRDKDRAKVQAFLDAKFGQERNVTALLRAADKSQTRIVDLLLKAGADYTPSTKHGYTVLMFSVGAGDYPAVKTILDHVATEDDKLKFKAFLNSKNCHGKTAFVDAAERDHAEIARLLIQAPGLDYTLQDNNGLTALHWSTFENSRSVATVILEIASHTKATTAGKFDGFLNERTTSNGHSALFGATIRGHYDLAAKLLGQYHALYDIYDNHGSSPLHIASLRSHISVAEMYLEKAYQDRGADGARFHAFLNRRNDAGKTAHDLAIEANDGRFIQLLERFGVR